jgi:ectoine hydroxylase-related dioxygenase (phytanoyl-CoA dioxygenase family)
MELNLNHEDILSTVAEKGFCILPSFLSPSDLALLQKDCNFVVNNSSHSIPSCIYEPVETTSSKHRTDSTVYGDARNNNSILSLLLGRNKGGKRLLEIVRLILGDEVYVLNEQYIVKPPSFCSKKRKRIEYNDIQMNTITTSFAWHRDADYLRRAGILHPEPSLSVWCALDDVDKMNGTLTFAPLDNVKDRVTIKEKAGTVVLISSEVLHCSSGNQSKHDRRVWMPQYSARPQRWECKKVTDGSISVSGSGSGSGSDNDNGNGNGNGCTVEVEGKDDEYVALAIKVEN